MKQRRGNLLTAPDKCEPAQNLFIAIPAYDGKITTQCASSLIEAVSALRKAGLPVMHSFCAGNCYIEAARNTLVQDFMDSGYSDMLFWDADVGALPETVARLAMATKPFVAAIYPKKVDKPEWPVEFFPGERWSDSEGLIPVKMVPTGLLRINRSVFERMPARQYTDVLGRKLKAYFRNDVREYFYGEDVEFCRRWRELGGKIYMLPDELLCHTGSKTWEGVIGEAMKAGTV